MVFNVLSSHANRIFLALSLGFLLPQGGLPKDHHEGRKVLEVQDFLVSKVADKSLGLFVHVPSVYTRPSRRGRRPHCDQYDGSLRPPPSASLLGEYRIPTLSRVDTLLGQGFYVHRVDPRNLALHFTELSHLLIPWEPRQSIIIVMQPTRAVLHFTSSQSYSTALAT